VANSIFDHTGADMAATHVGELPEGTKRCRVCAEPINEQATKCIHCQSDQNWKSRLGLSSTILSLLVALIAVIGAVGPIIVKSLTPEDSHLMGAFHGADRGLIHLLISNGGTRPGSVKPGGWVTLPDGKKQAIGMTFPTVPAERVVEPGKSSLVSFAVLPTIREGEGFLSTPGRRRDDTVGGIQVTETFPDRGSCFVSPEVTDFTGVHHTLSINVSCKELHQLVPRHEPIR
jgi:hypothetical protein